MKVLRLKEILKQKGVSSKDLAEVIGVNKITMSNLINHKTFTTKEKLIDIAKYLEIDIRDLFYSTKEKNERTFIEEGTGKRITIIEE